MRKTTKTEKVFTFTSTLQDIPDQISLTMSDAVHYGTRVDHIRRHSLALSHLLSSLRSSHSFESRRFHAPVLHLFMKKTSNIKNLET
jgi:hypothetical protein